MPRSGWLLEEPNLLKFLHRVEVHDWCKARFMHMALCLFHVERRCVMPAGANSKREHEYVELQRRFKREHRYSGREDEVAARIVNKQRKQYGETVEEKRKDKEGRSPDRGLPIDDYQHLTIPQILARLDGLSAADIRKIRNHESRNKQRKGLLAKLDRRLSGH
jgi:hypothetical protein